METTETRNPYVLAGMAECASPDSLESAGARFLQRVADEVTEEEWHEDRAWEIADGAVPIYTHELWSTFVDLAAYSEDIEEYGPITDIEQAAKTALFAIAERLANAVHDADGEE